MGKWCLCLAVALVSFAEESRVLFVSLDGLGFKNLTGDPAARELTTLHKLAAKGVLAPLLTAFPSKTSAGHAALFTGAWSGVNGIFSNTNPRTPRSRYALKETISGFRSESLQAETIWAAASRQGVSTVAYQATQLYPFAVREGAGGPAVINGYQSWMLAPHRAIHQRDVRELQPGIYQWTYGPLTFRIERLPDGLKVSSGTSEVVVHPAEIESAPPRKRPLARHFSKPLEVEANGVRSGVYLRLFEFSPTDFLLYRTSAQELATAGVPFDLQSLDGPFVGNSAVSLYERGFLGKTIPDGGDGIAERRYLETLELVVRQLTRQMIRLDDRIQPRLMVGYYPVVDDLEHLWFGLASTGTTAINPYRAWGYASLDEGLKPLLQRFRTQTVVFSSDHGMAGNTHELRMNALLEDLGFTNGKVVPNASCLFVNTTDWKDGVVPLEDKSRILEELEVKLGAQALITRIYSRPELERDFGLRGANSPDVCFDVKPLHYPTESARHPAVSPYPHARGEHGFAPTRPDMESYVIASGKGIAKGARDVKTHYRAIDITPLACAVLGIEPPKDAEGKPPAKVLASHR